MKKIFERIIKRAVLLSLRISGINPDSIKPSEESLDRLRKSGKYNITENYIFGEQSEFVIRGENQKIQIEPGFYARKFCNFVVEGSAELVIRKGVFFNNYCSVNCLCNIEIGDKTLFGEGVRIYDHNHEYKFQENRLTVETNKFTVAPVKIGKNCWIGSNVTILKGVEIGDNVIIGANCLIYKSVPANSIVTHNEALTVRRLD